MVPWPLRRVRWPKFRQYRDIKPSNVLVALYDDRPVSKVIDFGVAKATSHQLTEKTMFTQYGQIVGTIEYMSPNRPS